MAAFRVGIPTLAIIAAIGFLANWLHWYPHERRQEYEKAVLVGFILYALPAEIIFRSWLLSFFAQINARLAAWFSTIVFVLSFPVYALAHTTKWNDAFRMPSFWFAMLILGIVLSHIRIRSGSIWPGVILHGTAAMLWMALLGGRY